MRAPGSPGWNPGCDVQSCERGTAVHVLWTSVSPHSVLQGLYLQSFVRIRRVNVASDAVSKYKLSLFSSPLTVILGITGAGWQSEGVCHPNSPGIRRDQACRQWFAWRACTRCCVCQTKKVEATCVDCSFLNTVAQ